MTEPEKPARRAIRINFDDIVKQEIAREDRTKKPEVEARPVPTPKPSESTGSDEGPVDSVRRLLTLSPMLDYFTRVAERNYAHLGSKRSVVKQQRQDTPRLYNACIVIDVIFRTLAMTLLLGAVTILVLKGMLSPVVLVP